MADYNEMTEQANADARKHYEAKRAAMDAENVAIQAAAEAERASVRAKIAEQKAKDEAARNQAIH